MMDDRVKPGQLHEPVTEENEPDTYPQEGGDERPQGGYPNSPGDDFTPAPITRAADEGSAAQLRKERNSRHGESGGYDDPRYGKVRTAPGHS